MKIAEAVRIIFLNDTDVQIAGDDIVFESLADSTLQLLHEYMFSETTTIYEFPDDGVELSVTSSNDDYCAIEREPSVGIIIDDWLKKLEECNNNTRMIVNFTEIESLIRIFMPHFEFHSASNKMFFNVYQRVDGNLAIQLPQENDNRRDTIIISRDLFENKLDCIENVCENANITGAIESLTKQFSGEWFDTQSIKLNSDDETEGDESDLNETTQTTTCIDDFSYGSDDADDEVRY